MTGPRRERRARAALGNLLALLLGAAVVVLGLEAGIRLLWERLAPPLGRRNVELFLGQIDPALAFSDRPHPYMLYENTPGFLSPRGVREVNAQGYRNAADTAGQPAPGTLRILCLGGSTTYGYLLPDPRDAWPAQLEALLNGALAAAPVPGVERIEVVNGGLLHGMTPGLLLHYLMRDRYLGASLVVLHVGGNDASPQLFAEYSPDYSFFRTVEAGHRLRRGERALLRRSAIARLIYARWLADAPARTFVNKQIPSNKLGEEYYVANAERNEPVGFARYLDLLVRNIRADGATPVLFPFVMTSERAFAALGRRAARRADFTRRIRKGTLIALAKNVDVMRRVARSGGLPFFELAADEIPDADWLDHCHLSREGEAVKAAFLAERLAPLIAQAAAARP